MAGPVWRVDVTSAVGVVVSSEAVASAEAALGSARTAMLEMMNDPGASVVITWDDEKYDPETT